MKKTVMIILLSTLVLVLLPTLMFRACLNREVGRYSGDWARMDETTRLQDFAGRYSNAGEGAGDQLWYYLTKDEHSMHDAQIVISIPEPTLLRVQLTEGTNTLKSVDLERGKDFNVKRDHIRLSTEIGLDKDALGSAAGYAEFHLYKTVKGSLAGKRKGLSVGLCLHVIPAAAGGSRWTHWPRI